MPVKLRFSPTPPASRSAASAPTPARESAPGVGTAPGIGTAAGPDTPPHPGDDTLELIADYRLPPRARSVPSPTGPDSSSTPTRTADPETVTLNLEDDDLLEIELDDGLILWTTAEDFRDDADSLGISTDPDAPLDLEAPFASLDTAPSRGVRRAIARGLRIFRRRNTPVGDNIVEVVTALESRRPLGLYPVGGPQGLRALNPAERITAPLAKSDEPILILIHGTASSYEGSFGDLINSGHTGTAADSTAAAASTTPSDITDPVRPGAATNPTRLIDRYGQRIYAFEHRTLAQSPIDNAIELLELLPKNQPVAFLTHSRGGLVGELLCMHAAPDMKRLQAYRRDSVWLAETGLNDSAELRRTLTEADTRDRERLVQLAAALKTRRPKVVSFARVACPAQGTTLASRRLDRFLSILGNLIGLLPPLRASLLYAWFRNLARDVISRRVRPDQLPGLEAMLPYSPLVAFLNADDGAQIDGELGVIAGDIEGGRLLQRFGLLILDRLYRGDHDLVVDTASMAGGLARSGGTWRCFDQGERVSHFRYFANPGTRDALLAWLLRAADAEMPSAFARIGHAEGPALSGIQPAARPNVDTPGDTRNAFGALVTRTTLDTPSTRASRGETIHTPRPTLFLLPGTMGSHLKARRSRIWLTPGRILRGRLK
ncbi:MAG: hypothetical protein JJU27_11115, partial [Gammaproteobacteria bacterium]|nr:hypothetical protein [Gammaproteobacteria bacterium]